MIIEICVPYRHREVEDSLLGGLFVGRVDCVGVCVDIGDGGDVREEVVEEAEGDAEGEAVPELGDGVGGGARLGRRIYSEVRREVVYAHEAGAELGALLVEGGGLGGRLVKERVVRDGGLDLEACGAEDRLLAACGGVHRGRGAGAVDSGRGGTTRRTRRET